MRAWVKRGLVGLSAVLGILVYSMQFKKACEDASPYACFMSLVGWVGQGIVTPRDTALKTPQKPPPSGGPPPVKKVVASPPQVPPANTTTRPAGIGIAPVSNDNRDRRVMVTNDGNVPLESIYASNCTARHWGEDLLGIQMLPAGQSKAFTFDDGSGTCCFDLRAKFQNGVQRTNMNVDVCQMSRWTVNNR